MTDIKYTTTVDDATVRVMLDGTIVVSDMINGYRVQRVFQGYDINEAVDAFRGIFGRDIE